MLKTAGSFFAHTRAKRVNCDLNAFLGRLSHFKKSIVYCTNYQKIKALETKIKFVNLNYGKTENSHSFKNS